MGMRAWGKVIVVFALPLFFLMSCESNVDLFKGATLEYDDDANVVEFTVLMNQDSNFSVGATIPIEGYGDLTIVPSLNGESAKIILRAHVSIIGIAGDLTNELPNGAPLPGFIGRDLISVTLNGKYYIYVDAQSLEYVGFAVLIPSLDESFPAGSSLVSYFKNDLEEVIGAGVVFGPKVKDGEVVVSGGIFAVADLDLIINDISDFEEGYSVPQYSELPFKFKYKHYRKLKGAGLIK